LEFRLLGGVNLEACGHDVDLGTRKQRTVLAALLVADGRTVSIERLTQAVWGEDPPAQHRALLATYVSRLRRILGKHAPDVRIEHRPGGYAARAVAPSVVDVFCFQAAVAQARQAAATGDDHHAAQAFDAALAFWRGEPLAGLTGEWAAAVAVDLDRQHRDAHAERVDTLLRLGRAAQTLDLLHRLTTAHPLDEQFAAQLMQALHQAGRTAEALSHFEMMRRRLADDLGADPSPHLQEVHLRLLRADPSPPAALPLVPAQLPADVPTFTGRAEQLDVLDRLLGPDSVSTAVVVSAIAGTAGVGKTALAVHWAHRVRDRFPDGQLYVNLRGFDPGGTVMTPATAVRHFLDALDVPPQRVPADPDAQVNLYRTLLAGKSMLVVLDNARDPDQVGMLLPGTPGCLVLITSRNQLTGVVAAHGARHVTLDLLTNEEAHDLLIRRLGSTRVAAEPEAVNEIITACARLPLALTIVAARASIDTQLPLSVLADQLLATGNRLDTLSTGDTPRGDLRAVFSWSHQALSAPAARLFRLLGLHPGPDISTPAAASLTGMPIDQTRPLLAELTQANLIVRSSPGRYTFHDLLRAYAADLAVTADAEALRHGALHRMLDHYVHTAHAAARLLAPARDPLALASPVPGSIFEAVNDHDAALAWLTAERTVLLAVIASAAAHGFDSHSWQLARALDDFLDRRGHWHEYAMIQHTAVSAAERMGDSSALALAHRNLAYAYLLLGRIDDADSHLQCSLETTTRADDEDGQANTLHALAHICEQRGRYSEALEYAKRGLDLFKAVGRKRGQAYALNAVGWYHALLGENEQANTHCQQALALFQELGDRYGQAATWDSLGHACRHLEHNTQATTCYLQALDLYRDLGDRYGEADTLTHLGDNHHTVGDLDAARHAWQQAADILTELDHPDAERVRAKLRDTHPC